MSDRIEHKVDLEAGTLTITVPLRCVHRLERSLPRPAAVSVRGYTAFTDAAERYQMVIETGRRAGEVYDMTIDTDKATFDSLNEWWCGRDGGPQ